MRIKQHPILTFPDAQEIFFFFEGKKLIGHAGDMIAFALHDNGIKVLSHSLNLARPRGFYCAIGNCGQCKMRVDGVDNVRTCITPLRQGMHIEIQHGKGVIE